MHLIPDLVCFSKRPTIIVLLQQAHKSTSPKPFSFRYIPINCTMADEDERDLSWQKPDWTKNVKLRSTGKGDAVKTGGNLAAPITTLPHQKEAFEKPEWTGDVQAKEGTRVQGDLAKPITALPHSDDAKDLSFKKPEWTKDVEGKAGTRTAVDLAKPITALPHIEDKKDLSFKKPDWTTNKNLNNTKKGAALQEGKEIARPIGGIKAVED